MLKKIKSIIIKNLYYILGGFIIAVLIFILYIYRNDIKNIEMYSGILGAALASIYGKNIERYIKLGFLFIFSFLYYFTNIFSNKVLSKFNYKKLVSFLYNIFLLLGLSIYFFILIKNLIYIDFNSYIFNLFEEVFKNIKFENIEKITNSKLLGIFIIFWPIILIILKYIKNISIFLKKILNSYKFWFFVFGVVAIYLFLEGKIIVGNNIFIFLFSVISSLYFLLFGILISLIYIINFFFYEGEEGVYRKVFKELNEKGEITLSNFLNECNKYNSNKNFIEPISDEAIGIGKDIFGNKEFAKNIYDLMNGINFRKFDKSYSIGIVGEWGGGKSSIINLLEGYNLYGDRNFKVLRFNPWDYKKDKLINNFFGELSKILGIKDISSLFKNYLNLLGNIDSSVKIGIDFFSGFVGEKSLEEVRNEINFKLKEFDRKIVVVIDDLDRCEPDEVLMMLNLVKNLGDFNNIIYLVSYDKEHIIKVLEKKDFSGDYIEKIINIERFIPIPDKEQLKKYFENEFIKILKNIKKGNKFLYSNIKIEKITRKLVIGDENDLAEFEELFERENLRFIKKLLNQLNVILQLNLERENEKIKNLEDEDFKKIIIINYIKLKDFKWFNYMLNLVKNIQEEVEYRKPNRPKELLKLNEKYLYENFMKYILLLNYKLRNKYNSSGEEIHLIDEDLLIIKNENEGELFLNNPNKKLIENFS